MQNTGDVSVIFFDLDGTLTDPKEGITGCVQFALENMGETVPTKDELTWCIGPPLMKISLAWLGLSALAKPLAVSAALQYGGTVREQGLRGYP